MPAAGFRKAPDEFLIRSGEKKHAHVKPFALQFLERLERFVKGRVRACIDRHGRSARAACGEALRNGEKEFARKVVDAVKAAVFKLPNGNRFAAAGESRDDDELHDGASRFWS